MPTKYTHLIIILTLMWCLLFGCICNNCDDVPKRTEDLFSPISYADIMPFAGTEKYRFRKNGTDTIAFIGSGKLVYYDEVTRGGGDCPITYRLLNHKLNFVSSQLGNIQFWYYMYSETNAFSEFFEISINESSTGRRLAPGIYSSQFITLKISGISYPYIKQIGLSTSDSLYLNFNEKDSINYKILRFKYHGDVYELIP